jgi:hypothetical protein
MLLSVDDNSICKPVLHALRTSGLGGLDTETQGTDQYPRCLKRAYESRNDRDAVTRHNLQAPATKLMSLIRGVPVSPLTLNFSSLDPLCSGWSRSVHTMMLRHHGLLGKYYSRRYIGVPFIGTFPCLPAPCNKSELKQLCIRIANTMAYLSPFPLLVARSPLFLSVDTMTFSLPCSLSANPLRYCRFESDITRNILEKCHRIGHL